MIAPLSLPLSLSGSRSWSRPTSIRRTNVSSPSIATRLLPRSTGSVILPLSLPLRHRLLMLLLLEMLRWRELHVVLHYPVSFVHLQFDRL